MKNEAFSQVVNGPVGIKTKMIICFLKDVSSLLTSFIRTTLNDICKQNAKQSIQPVYLRKLQRISSNAITSLTQCGFGGSLSSCSFFSWHSDLITVIIFRSSLGRMLNRHRKRQHMGCHISYSCKRQVNSFGSNTIKVKDDP